MSLELAIDQLMETGWSVLDTNDHDHSPLGRLFPSPHRVAAEFRAAGLDLELKRVDLFDCYQAAWDGDEARQTVIGSTREEASVYALVRLRRRVGAGAV